MEPRWLIQSALTNAATVVLLAAVAMFVGRRLGRPALTHALWVIVLIKFVTPPLVGVPIPGEWLPESLTGLARTYLVHHAPAPVEQPSAAPAERMTTLTEEPVVDVGESSWAPGSAGTAPSSRSAIGRPGVFGTLVLLWLVGTCVYLVGITARIVHFSFRLRRGVEGIREADGRASVIGHGLTLRRIPAVTFIAQPCSPMLWGLGRFTRIVFPVALWNQLSPPCRDALLTHELSHYRRRDHWVRPLEIVVTGLFWWHPVVWWARREIEAAEEACCDAWVVGQSTVSPRTYAEALLAAVDYIASDSPSTVPAATGIGGAPDLQHRLRRIMRSTDSPVLPDFGRWLLLSAAMLLPLHPFITDPATATTLAARSADINGFAARGPVTNEGPPTAPRTEQLESPVDWTRPSGWWTWSPEDRWAVVESADGRFRLSAVAGNRVYLEDRRTGQRTDLGGEQITTVAFAPDLAHFITGSVDGTVRLWEAGAGEAQSLLGLHDAEVVSVDVSPSGQFAVSGSRDGALLIWDLGSGVVWSTWTDSRRPIVSVRIALDNRTIGVASDDWRSGEAARITLLTLESGSLESTATLSLPDSVAAIEFTEGGDALLAAAWDGTVSRWDLHSRNSTHAGEIDRSLASAAMFSADVRIADQVRRPALSSAFIPEVNPFAYEQVAFPVPQVGPADRSRE